MARNDAEYNRYIIAKFVRKYIRENGCMPTIKEIAESEEVKLSEGTVSKHLKGLKFTPQKHRLRLLTDDVLVSIYKSATDEGKVPAQRLWLEVMEGWTPPVPAPNDQDKPPMPPPQTAYYQASDEEDEEESDEDP